MSVDEQFNILNDKLQLLLKQYSRLQRENERLRVELSEARSREMANRHDMDRLQQQVSIMRISAGEMPESDKKEFEKKINQYLKEIDKCIAFLSQ
ncbi:MAG TPA: hypothetical protein VFR58_12835 [Flavisolibacter sp.]|nr:hypothetical protein [Flavisolibacter sp.]